MRISTNTPGTINLGIKECFGYTCAAATMFCICVAAIWSFFTYTGDKYDDLVDRQDRLHKETREYTEKMIEDKIADLGTQLSTQIGGISTAINNTQALIRDQANVMMHQVEKTATNKATLENVKEQLAEENLGKQVLEKDMEILQDVVEDITIALKGGGSLSPSNIEPASGPHLEIRPAFKPRH